MNRGLGFPDNFMAIFGYSRYNTKQPKPIRKSTLSTWDVLISVYEKSCVDDTHRAEIINVMKERKEMGEKKYGITLSPNNGRDNIMDAFQELLDALVYLENAILSHKNPNTRARQLTLKLIRSFCFISINALYDLLQ